MTATPQEPFGADTAPHLRLRSPRAIAAAIPHLTGPLPDCALTLLIFRRDETVGEIYVRELPAPPAAAGGGAADWGTDAGAVAAEGIRLCDLGPGESVVLSVQLPAPVSTPSAAATEAFLRQLRWHRPRLLDVLVTFDGRYRSLLCSSEACCPAQGQPIIDDPQALAALRRFPLLADAALPAPAVDEDLTGEVQRHLHRLARPRDAAERHALFERAAPLALGQRVLLAADEVALLVLAADLPGVRDALLVHLADEPDDVWWTQLALWHNIAADAPEGWAAGPEAMAAIASWMLDWESRARSYAQSALRERPNHRLAGLVVDALDKPLEGTAWLAALRGLSVQTCLEFDRSPDLG